MSWEFWTEISLLHACAAQVRATSDRLTKSLQDGLDLDARCRLLRGLESLRADMKQRGNRLWKTVMESYRGNRTDLIYLTSESNLQTLQASIQLRCNRRNGSSIEGDVDSDLEYVRATDSPVNSLPLRPQDRALESWPDVINGVGAPRAALENENRMSQLATAIFELKQGLEAIERDLTDCRDRYLNALSETFLNFPTSDRRRCDDDRELRRLPAFLDEERQLISDADRAKRDLEDARRTMRRYIDSKRDPTEDTSREQTNDRNSGNDAPGFQMNRARRASPRAVRR